MESLYIISSEAFKVIFVKNAVVFSQTHKYSYANKIIILLTQQKTTQMLSHVKLGNKSLENHF